MMCALDFDGVDDKVDHGDIAAMDGASALTIMAWINPDTFSANDAMFGRNADASNYWVLQQGSTADDVMFQIVTAAAGRIGETTSNLISTGAWHHVTVVYDGSLAGDARVAIYVDGAAQTLTYSGAGSFPATLGSYTVPFETGGLTGGLFADIKLSHLKVWTAALSAAEIAQEVHSFRPARTTNLIVSSPYDDGTSARDYSGQGNHGTVSGALQVTGPPVSYGAGV